MIPTSLLGKMSGTGAHSTFPRRFHTVGFRSCTLSNRPLCALEGGKFETYRPPTRLRLSNRHVGSSKLWAPGAFMVSFGFYSQAPLASSCHKIVPLCQSAIFFRQLLTLNPRQPAAPFLLPSPPRTLDNSSCGKKNFRYLSDMSRRYIEGLYKL